MRLKNVIDTQLSYLHHSYISVSKNPHKQNVTDAIYDNSYMMSKTQSQLDLSQIVMNLTFES